jgi:hypothetical protein
VERRRGAAPAGATASSPAHAWGALVGWLATLLVGVAVLRATGSGALAAPPSTDPGTWGAWAGSRGPLVATVALLRLGALALVWYLVGVTTIGMVARVTRAARLVRIADALTVPAVRRSLHGILGVGLATAMVGAAAPVPRGGPPPGAAETEATLIGEVELVRAEAVADATGPRPLPLELLEADQGGDELVMRRIADADEPAADRDVPERVEPGAVEHEAVEHEAVEHEVVAGESLWSIARDALAVGGRTPSDAEVHRYWAAVIERNRDRLADPDNPDLIFPDQRFELPPAPELEVEP